MYKIDCPFCGYEFEIEKFDTGNCPNCNKEYYWSFFWTDDGEHYYIDWNNDNK